LIWTLDLELELNISLAEAAALKRYFSRRSELSLAFTSGKLSRELLVEELDIEISWSWIDLASSKSSSS